MSTPVSPLLAGRRAIVLGTDEIGAGIARRLALAGAKLRLLVCTGSVTADIPTLRAAVVELGGLDILVANVLPESRAAPLEATAVPAFAAALERVTLAHAALQAVLPELRRQGGRIILIGHRYGETVNEGLAAYNSAAWALRGLMRTAAVEWGPHQIATNLLLPLADTAELRAAEARRPRVLELMRSQLPLGRVGEPSGDIGAAVVFLASDDACFINGEVVHADGGQHVAGPVLNPIRFAGPAPG